MTNHIKAIHTELRVLRREARELAALADAFSETGNESLYRSLAEHAHELDTIAKNIDTELGGHIDARFKESQESVGQVLSALAESVTETADDQR